MSRSSAAKKARRKTTAGRPQRGWLPDAVHADVKGVARIADEIIPRGWEFDPEFSTERVRHLVLPAVGGRGGADDESVEAVTRIWLRDPEEPHVDPGRLERG